MTSPQRTALMKRVRRRDTAPELTVRRFLHARGLRYRIHVRALPGTPDIVLPRHRAVVFVNGCFWHGHECPRGSIEARTNAEFWRDKIKDNRQRDTRKVTELGNLGWRVLTVWECESKDASILETIVRRIRETSASSLADPIAMPGADSSICPEARRGEDPATSA